MQRVFFFLEKKGKHMKKFELTARNKSLILSGIACVGVVLTGYFSAKGAVKAEEKENTKDKVIAYAPAIASGCAAIACIGASTYISGEEIGALTLALAASAQRFADYRKVVHENVSPEDEARINEAFYLKEIERLEVELAEREHPTEDDDLCEFIDCYSGYTFRACLDDVEIGIDHVKQFYRDNGYLAWCDIFYMLNDGDMRPYESALGNDYSDFSIGWSKNMIEDHFDDSIDFDIFLTPFKGRENAYLINYSVIPEACYFEY